MRAVFYLEGSDYTFCHTEHSISEQSSVKHFDLISSISAHNICRYRALRIKNSLDTLVYMHTVYTHTHTCIDNTDPHSWACLPPLPPFLLFDVGVCQRAL